MNPGAVLVDSNVVLDILTEDPLWFSWSARALSGCAAEAILAINPIIYAEVSIRFASIEDLEEALAPHLFERHPLPWEEGKGPPLPDFYIGAHAAVAGTQLLPGDASRYRAYFPELRLIAP